MSLDGSLVLDIALGIVGAKVLIYVFNEGWQILILILERIVPRNPPPKNMKAENEEDWLTLWSSLSEPVKQRVQRMIEDDQLLRRAREMEMWPTLWHLAPDEIKDRLHERWRAAGINPSKVGT